MLEENTRRWVNSWTQFSSGFKPPSVERIEDQAITDLPCSFMTGRVGEVQDERGFELAATGADQGLSRIMNLPSAIIRLRESELGTTEVESGTFQKVADGDMRVKSKRGSRAKPVPYGSGNKFPALAQMNKWCVVSFPFNLMQPSSTEPKKETSQHQELEQQWYSINTFGRVWKHSLFNGRGTTLQRSSEPQLRCTTSCGAELWTWWSQSKLSTKSQGREAATGILLKDIEMTPASHGSVRGPESWESQVHRPELMTQSRERQELAARPSNSVDMGKLHKLARDDIGGESRDGRRLGYITTLKFRVDGYSHLSVSRLPVVPPHTNTAHAPRITPGRGGHSARCTAASPPPILPHPKQYSDGTLSNAILPVCRPTTGAVSPSLLT
ncbi:hypothetical protein B0H13DRAFT_2503237 [Mycena leptocephala]|nr:hypothetical protein B0H13DRAFT_2503237 [Mycena leptocephala]